MAQVRVPEPLKPAIAELTRQYKQAVDSGSDQAWVEYWSQILAQTNQQPASQPEESPKQEACSERVSNHASATPSVTSELTAGQIEAMELLKAFVSSKEKFFRLTGYAGAGKSFLICHFMQWLQQQKISFTAGSPTNKAAKNLSSIAQESGLSFEATTLAKLLGQQPELDETTGKEKFTSLAKVTIDNYEVVILDEFSMISKSNFDEIRKAIQWTETKVIFVGDAAQLPPVGDQNQLLLPLQQLKNKPPLNKLFALTARLVVSQNKSEAIKNTSASSTPSKLLRTQQSLVCPGSSG